MTLQETSATVLLPAWLLCVLMVGIVARRMTAAALVALGVLPVVVGMALARTAGSYEGQVLVPYLVGAVALLLGCVAVPMGRGPSPARDRGELQLVWRRAAPVLAGVAIVGTGLHFYLVGIPIFSSNVEVRRFTSGSALFGFPSRMYQFGLPLAAAAALAEARSRGVAPTKHTLTRVVFGAMVLAGILSGFKSGLTAVVVTAVLLASVTGARVSITTGTVVRLAAGALLSTVFAFWVASHYGTYARRDIPSVLRDRILRASVDGPEAVLMATENRRFGSSSVGVDVTYFAGKYLGIPSGGAPFAFHERVSAAVTHTPLQRDEFLVPMTTTAIADTQYDVGLWPGAAAMVALGYTLQRAQREARAATDRPYRFLAYTAILLGGYSYVIKGGLVYALINWSMVYALFAGVCLVAVGTRRPAPAEGHALLAANGLLTAAEGRLCES